MSSITPTSLNLKTWGPAQSVKKEGEPVYQYNKEKVVPIFTRSLKMPTLQFSDRSITDFEFKATSAYKLNSGSSLFEGLVFSRLTSATKPSSDASK